MPVTTTTTVRSSNVAVHTISFRGMAGAIFILLTIASMLYVIGFATTSWSVNGRTHTGLWQTCTCHKNRDAQDWFRAVQAMIAIGLVGLLIAMILICIYMCVHTISKNTTIIAIVIICFVSAIFMLIGFIIFGTKVHSDTLSWSFATTVLSGILCAIAGVLAACQMRSSGVRM